MEFYRILNTKLHTNVIKQNNESRDIKYFNVILYYRVVCVKTYEIYMFNK